MRYPKYFFIVFIILFGCKHSDNSDNRDNKKNKEIIAPKSAINWGYADSIITYTESPEIPDNTFHLSDFGGKNETNRIQKAIDKAFHSGGGTVIIPRGLHYSGPIQIKSNINIHLEEGAELKFITDPKMYPTVYTWFDGIPCMNYSPMIYAKNAVNIKITGSGIIDGQGNEPEWKNMKYFEEVDWELLEELEDEDVKPVNRIFGIGHSLRPDLIGFIECSKIEISGVAIQNAPYWSIHPVLSDNIKINNCRIESSGYDQIGIAIESSSNIIVDSVEIKSVDEGIKIISGRVKIINNRASNNILIKNSKFEKTTYSAVSIGMHVKAGANRIFMSNLEINNTHSAFRISTNAREKGEITDIFIKNCKGRNILDPFLQCNIFNDSKRTQKPILFNIQIDEVTTDSCGRAFDLNGHSRNTIQNISIANSQFETFKGSFVEDTKNLSLSNVYINEELYDGSFIIGDIKGQRVKLSNEERDILDTDNINFSDLPQNTKNNLLENYPYIPIEDIDRMITQSNVLYEIDLELETSNNLQLLIQNDGTVIRTELDIAFSELPFSVIAALESYIKATPVSFLMNNIKKVNYQDLTYFEIEGEYDNKLFVVGITDEGDIIEEKQTLITTYFSQKL
jgi:polygalacturonase